MRHININRLKKARLYRGLTVEELAKEINITKQALSQCENGKTELDYKNLFSVSKILNFPLDYFMQDDVNEIESKSTYFRALMKTSKKYRIQQIVKMEHLSTLFYVLKKYIKFPEINLPKLDNNLSIEEKANELRKLWNLKNSPINDLTRVIEKNGIIVSKYNTSTNDIDAFSHLVNINGEYIYLIGISNNKNSASRINFDLAHELGHILLHEWSEDVECLTREEFKVREKEANLFASCFLLPKDKFIKDVSIAPTNLNHYIHLKEKWKVSIAAMVYRSYKLDIVSKNQYEYIVRTMNCKGWKKEEPLDNVLRTAEPSILKYAIELLLNQEVFSVCELLEEFKENGIAMDRKEIEILCNLPKDKLKYYFEEKDSEYFLKIQ